MNSKERLLKALNLEKPDRLPVTTHHLMPSYLNKYLNGADDQDFFRQFNLDPILWVREPELKKNQQFTSLHCARTLITSDEWRIKSEEITGQEYSTYRFTIETPSGNLSTVLQSNIHTSWVFEHLIKEKKDIDIIMKHAPFFGADIVEMNNKASDYGNTGMVRSEIPSFEIFGQPGCWQDMSCLVGIEKLIMGTFDDPEWIHTFLGFLRDRKIHYVNSLKGAKLDLIEFGGGDASTTVISPDIFRNFVSPYDSAIIDAAKKADQKIVYHTCGGMMPILEDIVAMGPAAIETLTPPGMGGDVDLKEVKRRVGDKVCLIGGFDQGRYFMTSTVSETKKAVRDAFEAAGDGGGLILSPSDHFFTAKPELIQAFVDEAVNCRY